MASSWSPSDIQRLTTTCTGCSCLVILVGCISFGAITGKISPTLLGDFKGYTIGGGLLGLAMILFLVIRAALPSASPAHSPPPAADTHD
jgi:hypothetical protein